MIHRFPAFKLLADCILGVDASAGLTQIGGIHGLWDNMYCNYSGLFIQQWRYGCCVDVCIKIYDVLQLLCILVNLQPNFRVTVKTYDGLVTRLDSGTGILG